jgi:hypothetical protein
METSGGLSTSSILTKILSGSQSHRGDEVFKIMPNGNQVASDFIPSEEDLEPKKLNEKC